MNAPNQKEICLIFILIHLSVFHTSLLWVHLTVPYVTFIRHLLVMDANPTLLLRRNLVQIQSRNQLSFSWFSLDPVRVPYNIPVTLSVCVPAISIRYSMDT